MRSSSASTCRFRVRGRRARRARSRRFLPLGLDDSTSKTRLWASSLGTRLGDDRDGSQGRTSVRTFDPSPGAPSEDGFRASADWLRAMTPFRSRTDRVRLVRLALVRSLAISLRSPPRGGVSVRHEPANRSLPGIRRLFFRRDARSEQDASLRLQQTTGASCTR
jgi:hypothetical protein